jgi:hypothetical protein
LVDLFVLRIVALKNVVEYDLGEGKVWIVKVKILDITGF